MKRASASCPLLAGTAPDGAGLTALLTLCTSYVNRIKAGRTGKSGQTAAESLARQALLHGLDPIRKGAPAGATLRARLSAPPTASARPFPANPPRICWGW